MWAACQADVAARLKPMKITRRALNARKLQRPRIIARVLLRRRVPIR